MLSNEAIAALTAPVTEAQRKLDQIRLALQNCKRSQSKKAKKELKHLIKSLKIAQFELDHAISSSLISLHEHDPTDKEIERQAARYAKKTGQAFGPRSTTGNA